MLRLGAFVALLSGVALAAPPSTPPSLAPADEVLVRGYPPHCHRRPGDPLDDVDLSPARAATLQQVIRRDAVTGQFGVFRDDYPETGEEEWQRDGTHIDRFIFRVPTDGSPLCIGSRERGSRGFAQLRRAFQARPYWGKVLRFTAFVATRRVNEVRFWIAAGSGKYEVDRRVKLGSNILLGGVGPRDPIKGSHDWMPISYTIGPIPCLADQISYGVTLDGGGDVWIYQPELTIVADAEISSGVKHGKAFTDSDYHCRKRIHGYDPRDSVVRQR